MRALYDQSKNFLWISKMNSNSENTSKQQIRHLTRQTTINNHHRYTRKM